MLPSAGLRNFERASMRCIRQTHANCARLSSHPRFQRARPPVRAGARCTATLLHEMKRRGKGARFGVVSMCIGSGMGAAAVFEQGSEADALANAGAVDRQEYLSPDAVV